MAAVRILTSLEPFEWSESETPPPNYIKMFFQERGEFYISPRLMSHLMAKQGLAQHLHPEFPPELRQRMEHFSRVFRDVYQRSPEEWELGFREDRHPWREIALWDLIADGFRKFTGHIRGRTPGDLRAMRDVLQVILSLTNNGPSFPPRGRGAVSERRAREIAAWVFGDRHKQTQADAARYRTMIAGDVLHGPDRVAIHALVDEEGRLNRSADFDPWDLIESAGVILGVNVSDGHEFLVYGRDLLESVARGGEEREVRVLRVELDQETDELDMLVAIIESIRGRHDYPGGTRK
jgi:hypothetical protein